MIALAILRLRNLLAVVMLSGIYSLLSAGLFVTMDAVDVAFTEAAVGGGIATVLLLATLALTSDEEKPPETKLPILPLLVVLGTGEATIEIDPRRPWFRFTHRVRHDRASGIRPLR